MGWKVMYDYDGRIGVGRNALTEVAQCSTAQHIFHLNKQTPLDQRRGRPPLIRKQNHLIPTERGVYSAVA